MNKNKLNKNIPEGTRDIVYEEVLLYEDIIKKLSEVFIKDGFRQINTPAVEFYDVFDCDKSIKQESMYKLTDMSGRLVVLRADNTTPMARVAATKLRSQPFPQKLFYNQNIYRINSGYSGRRNEIVQSGVEIIGAVGIKSDLLCIKTAIEALKAFGLNYKIEIGHVGYYNAMIEDLGLDESETQQIRAYVDQKNLGKIAKYNKINKIPLLYGGIDTLGKAQEIAGENQRALDALNDVRRLYTALESAGYGKNIIVDMGIVHHIDYYTGMVFRGYVEGAGEPVLTGGRYDHLLRSFDMDAAATGFAVNVCLIADAVQKQRGLPSYEKPQYLIHFESEDFAAAERFRSDFESKGIRCEYSCFNDIEQSLHYAQSKHIAYLAVVSQSGIRIELV